MKYVIFIIDKRTKPTSERKVKNMALTNEDLMAISDLMDEKLDPINGRLDGVDKRLDRMDKRIDGLDRRLTVIEVKQDRTAEKLDDLQVDVKNTERNIKKAIHKLNDEMETVIEVLRVHEMMPR